MDTIAVVMERPEHLALRRLPLATPGEDEVVVEVEWSGISTGTERLLWSGRMPPFPGMGYPLIPGYESVGRVVAAGAASGTRQGARVFVPGARWSGAVRGLFGGAARHLVAPGRRVLPLAEHLGEEAVLLALPATAWHAMQSPAAANASAPDATSSAPASPGAATCVPPDLIVGHGVLGRLLARLTLAIGAPPPVVWERNPARAAGASGYQVIAPEEDRREGYRAIFEASGDSAALDRLIAKLARGGEIVLAGFYAEPLSFAFPPAFLREARLRVAAEWAAGDLAAVRDMVEAGRLSLAGLITHRAAATTADAAYRTAFGDPACLKMILDWRVCS